MALGVERDVAADVAADAAVGRHLEDHLLAREVERGAVEPEARQVLAAPVRREVRVRAVRRRVALVDARRGRIVGGRVEPRRVVEVDPAGLLEVRVDGDRLETVLVVRVHRDAGRHGRARPRGGVEDAAVPRRVDRVAVRQHGEPDRLAGRLAPIASVTCSNSPPIGSGGSCACALGAISSASASGKDEAGHDAGDVELEPQAEAADGVVVVDVDCSRSQCRRPRIPWLVSPVPGARVAEPPNPAGVVSARS